MSRSLELVMTRIVSARGASSSSAASRFRIRAGWRDIPMPMCSGHAIADALLGAIGERDIGHHFPNTDETIRGISSLEILRRVGEILAEKKFRVANVDATLIAEAPKIGPHLAAMRANIAAALGIRGHARRDQGDDERRNGRARSRRRNGRDGGGERGGAVKWKPIGRSNRAVGSTLPFN